MTFLEKLVLARGERRLAPFRIQAALARDEHATLYAQYLSQIETAYARATHWHGTGRYHYEHADNSRYANNTHATLDVLGSIAANGGLRPHFDPWLPVEGKCRESVSLATARMHSRVFARIHLYKTDTLLFELGDTRYWVPLFLSLLAVWLCEKPLLGAIEFIRITRRTPLVRSFQIWASAIRKPHNGTVASLADVLSGNAWSDIPGNHPILFGVSEDAIQTYAVAPFLKKAEVRTLELVPLSSITHIEVPLAKVEETTVFLREKNVAIPILPIEFCDIYCSDQSLQELMYV